MAENKLVLDGLSCSSCERIIDKVVQQNGGRVNSIDAASGEVSIVIDDEKLDSLKKQLADKGFPGRNERKRGDPAGVLKYISSIASGEKHVEVENSLVTYSILSALVLIALGTISYLYLPSARAYFPLISLSIGSSIIAVSSYSHLKCFRDSISCMNGMMAGMTIGMVSGFLFGAIVGATNGMFMGSVAGMAVGIALGTNVGRCCGIMGAMEGMMAGLMSGTMGAMLGVMMISDNLLPFLYLLFGVCAMISGGLSYMMYRESGSASRNELVSGAKFFIASALLSALVILMMMYGPKGPITYP